MKRYRITLRTDGTVICWVQPSKRDRYALPFAPAFSKRRPFMSVRTAYAGLPYSGHEHLTRAFLADYLGPDQFWSQRFSSRYLQPFSAQFSREHDPLGTTITRLEIDTCRLSWHAQRSKPRRRQSCESRRRCHRKWSRFSTACMSPGYRGDVPNGGLRPDWATRPA